MDANSPATAPAGGVIAAERGRAVSFLGRRDRFHPAEALPWLVAIAAYFIFPNQMVLGSQTLIMILFALSLDLILGYAGIVTLGHAAYFGVGAYTAALLVTDLHWSEPISGLVCAAIVAAIAGFLSGWLLLRYRGLALLVLTLSTTIMLQQLGNLFRDFTGGYDGIPGINIAPLFGRFDYDLYGHTYYSVLPRRAAGHILRACAASSIRRSDRHWSAFAKTSAACMRSARRCIGAWLLPTRFPPASPALPARSLPIPTPW